MISVFFQSSKLKKKRRRLQKMCLIYEMRFLGRRSEILSSQVKDPD